MRRYRTLRPFAILLLTTVLGACGTRGPLFLPPAQSKPAHAENTASAPAKAPARPSNSTNSTEAASVPAAADLNTPPDAAQ